MTCEKDEEDDLYKIYEQFKELSLNVTDNDKISDSKEENHIAEMDHIPKEIPTKEGSYTMAETSSPTTISDLKEEINNLKEDITHLKEKNVVIEVRLDAIQALQNLDNASESFSPSLEEDDSIRGDNHSINYRRKFINFKFAMSILEDHIISLQDKLLASLP
ncbi:hypothetical protein H5410_002052 [Solanum commersonii]|uniref:Uncharacterized protein n=1 Tax=Solanum commersonii TaxID=4109 RepID=A0A9J6B1T4_SOLCO|nr:hypothetical protein H5410_002052 [Solanum commersonii]